MTRLLFLALALPAIVFAKGYRIAAGSTTIPVAFSISDAASQVGACQGNVIEIINETTAPIAFGIGTSTAVPAFDFAYVPKGSSQGAGTARFKPKGGVNGYAYIRAAGGSTATASDVFISCYPEEKP